MHLVAACSLLLALRLPVGDAVVDHAVYDDRIAWVLPPDRLAAAERSGFVIDEDTRTTIVGHATVTREERGLVTVSGTLFKETVDVPRHRSTSAILHVATTTTSRNDPLPAARVDLEQAPMVDLPANPVCVGSRWTTHEAVTTTLGSGTATIRHTVAGLVDGLVEVDISGEGVITGMEYNLPRLLPGSIRISGSGWFDASTGYLRQASYLVEDRLLRTVKRRTIGFVERETVNASTMASPPGAAR